jgi:hypothetical protein
MPSQRALEGENQPGLALLGARPLRTVCRPETLVICLSKKNLLLEPQVSPHTFSNGRGGACEKQELVFELRSRENDDDCRRLRVVVKTLNFAKPPETWGSSSSFFYIIFLYGYER